MLGWEDHGILTFHLETVSEVSHQAAGGYALDGKPSGRGSDSKRVPSIACGQFIMGILEAVGVSKWEDLPGQTIYVYREDCKRGLIKGISALPGSGRGGVLIFEEVQ